MNKHEIDRLLKRIGQGDECAFEKLYCETKRGVYAFLFTYLNEPSDCEDALQTVYLKIRTNIARYMPGTNGLAWILQIAKNTALNEIRARKTRLSAAAFENNEENAFDLFSERDSVRSAIKRALDEEESRIVVLHVVLGYKHREIAGMLEMPLGTVTSKYKRAVAKLKKEIKEDAL